MFLSQWQSQATRPKAGMAAAALRAGWSMSLTSRLWPPLGRDQGPAEELPVLVDLFVLSFPPAVNDVRSCPCRCVLLDVLVIWSTAARGG